MTFTESIKTCFSKYITIEGRARRSEYWWFLLFSMLGSFVFGLVDQLFFGDDTSIFGALFSLGILLPAICVAVRRLHDRDMSGWWFLLNIIPVIGSLILLVIYALPGTDRPNRFGPDPLRAGGEPDQDDDQSYSQSSIPRSGRD